MIRLGDGPLQNFDWLRTRYVQAMVTVDMGFSTASVALRCCLTQWPRFGRSRLYFGLIGVFKALKIHASSCLSKWRFERMRRWATYIRNIFGGEQFIEITRKKGAIFDEAFLPYSSASAIALLLLLNRRIAVSRLGA